MSEKIAEIVIKTGRFTKPTPNASSNSLVSDVFFSRTEVARLTKTNIGPRANLFFGLGKNLGMCRLYLNEEGLKMSNFPGQISRFAMQISENSVFPIYASHKKDYQGLQQHATLGRANGKIFIEFALMPASYDKDLLEAAVKTLRAVPGMDNWMLYVSRTLPVRAIKPKRKVIASSRATAPIAESVDANIWNTVNKPIERAPTETKNEIVAINNSYFIIKQGGEEELWLKKSSINVDCFKVIHGKPVVNTPNGELAIDSSVQDFLTAIES
jgi:hypothetical protein